MNLIQFVINRKTFISMLFIGLVLLGYISYKQLPVELFPNAELPFLIVQVNGAREMDPEYMEKQAIIPLEGAARGVRTRGLEYPLDGDNLPFSTPRGVSNVVTSSPATISLEAGALCVVVLESDD